MRKTLPLLTLALAALPSFAQDLTPEQLEAAARVYLGTADCEFKQNVHLQAIEGRPGHFMLTHQKAKKTTRYTLVPEVTRTGAVRLEDRQAGVVWLQIPAKSMLLNAKLGRRELDACLHAEQRAEQLAEQRADLLVDRPAEPPAEPPTGPAAVVDMAVAPSIAILGY